MSAINGAGTRRKKALGLFVKFILVAGLLAVVCWTGLCIFLSVMVDQCHDRGGYYDLQLYVCEFGDDIKALTR
ncbi:hypothetical protein C7534_113117 [Pseudomonas sp. OV226]|nr:hypothetical protein C7534_113117 [Pseudomonas sp. OV226]